MNNGDLVLTRDGYYAIVIDAANQRIFQANGLEPVLDAEEWAALANRVQPLRVDDHGIGMPGVGVANFHEILRPIGEISIPYSRRVATDHDTRTNHSSGTTIRGRRQGAGAPDVRQRSVLGGSGGTTVRHAVRGPGQAGGGDGDRPSARGPDVQADDDQPAAAPNDVASLTIESWLRSLSIGECKQQLGIGLFDELPAEYAHLKQAPVRTWQDVVQQRLDAGELLIPPGLFERHGADCLAKPLQAQPTYRSSSAHPPKTNVGKSRVVAGSPGGKLRTTLPPGEAELRIDPPPPASADPDMPRWAVGGRLQGYFRAEDAREAGQRHEDVDLPTGGRGDMIVERVLSEPDENGHVLAEVLIVTHTPPELPAPQDLWTPPDDTSGPLIPIFIKMAEGHGPPSQETVRQLCATVNHDRVSDYVRVGVKNGWCPECHTAGVWLLMPRDHRERMRNPETDVPIPPMFYICGKCFWMGELGVGLVEEETR